MLCIKIVQLFVGAFVRYATMTNVNKQLTWCFSFPPFRLQVHYPPHVTLKSDKGDLLEEGERVRFSCSASANPSQVSYAWYVGGRRVADAPDASTELVLDHVDRRLHNHLVKCEVTNPIGRSEQSAVLNIACEYSSLCFHEESGEKEPICRC